MINRIYHGFLQGGVGNFEKAVGFCPITMLYDAFFNDRVLQERQRVFEDHVQGTGECLLREIVTARSFGELHHINLRLGKELLGCRVEEHQTNIQRVHRFGGTVGNSHLAA